MSVYIPLWLMLAPVIVLLWVTLGWIGTVLIFAVEVGIALGTSSRTRVVWLLLGPITLGLAAYIGLLLWFSRRRHKM